MRVLIVGFGVQGRKRSKLLGSMFVGSVDPKAKDATYENISLVPKDSYDVVFLCVPDDQKMELIDFCLQEGKHILVEKPILLEDLSKMKELEVRANKSNTYIYTAYNHRFEPHIKTLKEIIDSKELGKLFLIRMYYGNGTARLVKASEWRDTGLGVVSDLAPHLLDILAFFVEQGEMENLSLRTFRFETNAPDHAVVQTRLNGIEVQLEMSLCMWRNSFYCDIIGDMGSAHITSLCKWGPSSLILRKREFPSGKPTEKIVVLEMPDPTWEFEHEYFFNQISNKAPTDLSNDVWIQKALNDLSYFA
jgi:scyllo-inositol 2-dehydrogenase (NADP+)